MQNMEKLTVTVKNAIIRAGIKSDEELCSKTYSDLIKIRYIGQVGIEEINKKVRIQMGLEPLVGPTVTPRPKKEQPEMIPVKIEGEYMNALKGHIYVPLRRTGICSDELLCAKSYEELMKIRHIGPAAIEIINRCVREPLGYEPLKPEK